MQIICGDIERARELTWNILENSSQDESNAHTNCKHNTWNIISRSATAKLFVMVLWPSILTNVGCTLAMKILNSQ